MTRTELEGLLPEVFRRTVVAGGLLDGLLDVMRAMHEPAERVLDELPTYFDPYLTPPEFLAYLATWLDLDRFLSADASEPFPAGSGRLRELIANGARLSGARGTADGLRSFLEIATGHRGFVIHEGFDLQGESRPFTVTIECPAEVRSLRPLIERIVTAEKPLHVVAHVTFGPPGTAPPGDFREPSSGARVAKPSPGS